MYPETSMACVPSLSCHWLVHQLRHAHGGSLPCAPIACGLISLLTLLIVLVSQVGLSMIKNMESAWWTSAIGAIMSLVYSIIALVLGAANVGGSETLFPAAVDHIIQHGVQPTHSAANTNPVV